MAEWDFLNWQTMVIELAVAGGMAIILSMYFYKRQKRDQQHILKLESQQKNLKLDFAINKIRSHLGYLLSLYESFLKVQTTANGLSFVDSDVEDKLRTKNEELDLLQNTINQASDVLDMDWMNRLNDVCILIRDNPSLPPHLQSSKLKMMICDRCPGIINQIKDILKSLPNPPV